MTDEELVDALLLAFVDMDDFMVNAKRRAEAKAELPLLRAQIAELMADGHKYRDLCD